MADGVVHVEPSALIHRFPPAVGDDGGADVVPVAFLGLLALSALLAAALLAGLALGNVPLAAAVFLAALLYDALLGLFVVGCAFRQVCRRRSRPSPGVAAPPPAIATVIPAWNEGASLLRTVETLLAQEDQPEEIIVADDGSSDRSLALLQERFAIAFPSRDELGVSACHPHLRVLRKPHSGKADSLNRAIARTTAEVVMVLDADTLLCPGAIAAVRRSFARHPDVDAVGGVLLPTCSDSRWGRWFGFFQRYEYVIGHLWRLTWSRFDATLLISGACGAFRRGPLLAAGGFDPSSWTEDYEVMFRLHRHLRRCGRSCRVRIEPDFVARTEAPETIPTFLRQRRRWIGGAAETLFRYRHLVGNRRYGALGMLHLAHNTVVLAQPVAVAGLLLMGVLAWGSLPLGAFFAIVWIPLFAKIGLNQLIVLGRLWIYRRDVGACGTSYAKGVLEELIRPLFYRPLQLVSYLWGYWSAVGRNRAW